MASKLSFPGLFLPNRGKNKRMAGVSNEANPRPDFGLARGRRDMTRLLRCYSFASICSANWSIERDACLRFLSFCNSVKPFQASSQAFGRFCGDIGTPTPPRVVHELDKARVVRRTDRAAAPFSRNHIRADIFSARVAGELDHDVFGITDLVGIGRDQRRRDVKERRQAFAVAEKPRLDFSDHDAQKHIRRGFRQPRVDKRRRAIRVVVHIDENEPWSPAGRPVVCVELFPNELLSVLPINRTRFGSCKTNKSAQHGLVDEALDGAGNGYRIRHVFLVSLRTALIARPCRGECGAEWHPQGASLPRGGP